MSLQALQTHQIIVHLYNEAQNAITNNFNMISKTSCLQYYSIQLRLTDKDSIEKNTKVTLIFSIMQIQQIKRQYTKEWKEGTITQQC